MKLTHIPAKRSRKWSVAREHRGEVDCSWPKDLHLQRSLADELVRTQHNINSDVIVTPRFLERSFSAIILKTTQSLTNKYKHLHVFTLENYHTGIYVENPTDKNGAAETVYWIFRITKHRLPNTTRLHTARIQSFDSERSAMHTVRFHDYLNTFELIRSSINEGSSWALRTFAMNGAFCGARTGLDSNKGAPNETSDRRVPPTNKISPRLFMSGARNFERDANVQINKAWRTDGVPKEVCLRIISFWTANSNFLFPP